MTRIFFYFHSPLCLVHIIVYFISIWIQNKKEALNFKPKWGYCGCLEKELHLYSLYHLFLQSAGIWGYSQVFVHSKKIGVLPNPQKRFRRCLKVFKGVESLKKKDKNIYETFKGSSRGYTGRTFSCEIFFKFCTAEKGFVGKYEAFRVLY